MTKLGELVYLIRILRKLYRVRRLLLALAHARTEFEVLGFREEALRILLAKKERA